MTDLSRHAMLSVKTDPVALLVDGENLSSDFAGSVLQIAKEFGVPTVRRVYGKAAHIGGWADKGYKLVPTRAGKNATDILLCIEAVNLALRERFHTLIIAASDRDYAYVAENLRELGHEVIGIGEPSAEKGYRATCSAFVELVRAVPERVEASADKVINSCLTGVENCSAKTLMIAAALTEVDNKLKNLLKNKRKLSFFDLGNSMKGQTVFVQTGKASWRTYINSRADLYRIDGTSAASMVSWIGP